MVRRSDSRQSFQARPGLTLIDFVVSTLVLGILAAAALPRFSGALVRNRLSAAALRVCADVRFARNSAIASSATKRIEFDPALEKYTLVGVPSIDRPGTDYLVPLSTGAYDVMIVSANLGGDANLTFDLHGQPDSGGTIVLQSGSRQKTVIIDAATGEARVQ
ncbi:MAG TPA: GspH/FimT family pseudopilin [Caulifigura sp.]|nr:GspH/FimT family pseudopilin [Caulifigura sp.]